MQYFCFVFQNVLLNGKVIVVTRDVQKKIVFRVRFRGLRYSKPPEIC